MKDKKRVCWSLFWSTQRCFCALVVFVDLCSSPLTLSHSHAPLQGVSVMSVSISRVSAAHFFCATVASEQGDTRREKTTHQLGDCSILQRGWRDLNHLLTHRVVAHGIIAQIVPSVSMILQSLLHPFLMKDTFAFAHLFVATQVWPHDGLAVE